MFRYQATARPITGPLAHYVWETPIWRFAEPTQEAKTAARVNNRPDRRP